MTGKQSCRKANRPNGQALFVFSFLRRALIFAFPLQAAYNVSQPIFLDLQISFLLPPLTVPVIVHFFALANFIARVFFARAGHPRAFAHTSA